MTPSGIREGNHLGEKLVDFRLAPDFIQPADPQNQSPAHTNFCDSVALHVNLDKMPELRRETFTA